MRISTIAVVLYLVVSLLPLTAEEPLFEHTSSESWELKSGEAEVSSSSIYLKKVTELELVDTAFQNPLAGRLSFQLYIPKPSEGLLMPTDPDCYCAVKVRMGNCQLEIAEQWIRLQQLSPDLHKVDTILQEIPFEMADYKGEELPVILETSLDSMYVTVSDLPPLESAIPEVDFRRLALSTFHGEFSIDEFRLEEGDIDTIRIAPDSSWIEIAATYRPDQFNTILGLKNHHLITWTGGKAGNLALFTTPVHDSTVYQLLMDIGAEPGNNLTNDTWAKRGKKSSKEPDKLATGMHIGISFHTAKEALSLGSFIENSAGKKDSFVFAGNLELIPIWQSGCVVCLQSCPGSKIANRAFTIRDLHEKRSSYTLKKSAPLKKGERLYIRFTKENHISKGEFE